MDIGPGELIIVVAVVLLLFGGSRIPQLARSLGEAQREFRKAVGGEPPTNPTSTTTTDAADDQPLLHDSTT